MGLWRSREIQAGLGVAVLVAGCGCAVPPREGNPSIEAAAVRPEFFARLNVRVLSVGGATVPEISLRRSMATVQKHLRVGMTLTFAPDQAAAVDPMRKFIWPVDASELGPEERGVRLLRRPEGGVLGVVRVPAPDGLEAPERALVERGTILIAILPGPDGGAGITGYATGVMRPATSGAEKDPPEPSLGMVVCFASAIERRSGAFVDAEKLWEWTLTHELGHVLGVPADASHHWLVPGLGVHCTHPECVMYTGIDWRVVVSGLLHGWPLDYCDRCAGELRRARAAWAERRPPSEAFGDQSSPAECPVATAPLRAGPR